MADLTTLGIKIDIKEIEKAVRALDELATAAKQAEKATDDVGKTVPVVGKEAEASYTKAARALKQLAQANKDNAKAELESAKAARQNQATTDAELANKISRQNKYAESLARVERLDKESAARSKANADLIAADVKKKEEAANLFASKAAKLDQQRSDAERANQIKRQNSYAESLARLERLEEESKKRRDLISAKVGTVAAQGGKFSKQGDAATTRATAYAANQQSLVENRALATQSRIEQGAKRLTLQQEKFEYQKARAAERAAKQAGSAWETFMGGVRDFRDLTLAGFGIGGLGDLATSVIKTADNMTLLESRLKLATKSTEDFRRVKEQLFATSQKEGLNIESQIDTYTQLERSTRAMGLSTDQLTFLTDSFAKAAIVSGASTESYKSALTQLNQGFAAGALRGQEFNSVAEQAPAIMEALANGMRGTNKTFDDLEKKGYLGVAALRKMAGEGQLINSVTMPALLKGLSETNKQFESMPVTVGRATESLSTAYKKWIGDQNSATGATTILASGIQGLANNFNTLISVISNVGVVAAAVFGGKLLGAMGSMISTSNTYALASGNAAKATKALAKEQYDAAKATMQAAQAEVARLSTAQKLPQNLIAMQKAQETLNVAVGNAAQAQQAYSVATKNASVATRAAAAATNLLGSAFAAVGGWPTLIVGGVMLIVSYWEDIKAVLGSTEAQANKTKNALVAAANAYDFKTAGDLKNKAEAEYKRIEGLLLRQNQKVNEGRKSGMSANDLADTIAARDKLAEQLSVQRGVLNTANEAINSARERKIEEALNTPAARKYAGGGLTNISATGPVPDTKTTGGKGGGGAEPKFDVQGYLNSLTTASLEGIDKVNAEEKAALDRAKELLTQKKISSEDYQKATVLIAKEASNDRAKIREKEAEDVNDWLDDQLKAEEEAAKKRQELFESSRKVADPLADLQADYDAKLQMLDEYNKQVSERDLAAQTSSTNAKLLIEQEYTNRKMEMQEQIYRAQGEGNAFVLDSLEALKSTTSSALTGMINGTMSAKDAMLSLATTMQSKVIDTLVDMGFQYIKNSIIAQQSATTAAAAQVAASGTVTAANIAGTTASTAAAVTGATQIAAAAAPAAAMTSAASFGTSAVLGLAALAALMVAAKSMGGSGGKFAKGGVFDGPVGAGSGVVSTPTTFAMSGGQTGLMGEAGPEAIMPLSRDANGRLGVTLNGGSMSSGGGVVQSNTITITIQGGSTNEETASVLSKELVKTMRGIADEAIIKSQRQGGLQRG